MDPEISEVTRSVQAALEAVKEQRATNATALAEIVTTQQTLGGQLLALEQKFSESQIRSGGAPGNRLGAMQVGLAAMFKDQGPTLASLLHKRGSITLESPIQLRAIVSGNGDSPGGGFPAPSAVDGQAFYAEPTRPLTLLAALSHEPTDKSKYTFVKAYDVNSPDDDYDAAAVNEGGAKPEASIAFDPEEVSILTFAVLAKISNQLLADVPGLQAELTRLLTGSTLSKFERYVVSTLLADAPVYTTSGSAADRISGALADLQGRSYEQPIVALNPADWHTLRISKASTAGSYLAGNWNTGPTPSIWNAPIVVNSQVTAGHALIVDRSAATILDRQLVTVDLGTDGDDFSKNLRTLRVEIRGGLAIRRHFGLMTFPLA